jgi:SAM-dependent methyltransferase
MKKFNFTSPVLEVGCGTGETLKELSKLYNIKGVDLSDDALNICRTKGLAVEKRDLFNVSERFNSIICVDVVEHISDDQLFANHLYKVLNPGGKIFVLVPSGKFLKDDEAFGHYRRYSRSAIIKLLKSSNFVIESTEMFGYPIFYYARIMMNFLYRDHAHEAKGLKERTLESSYKNPFDNTVFVKILDSLLKMPLMSKLLFKFFEFQNCFVNGNKGFAVIVIASKA